MVALIPLALVVIVAGQAPTPNPRPLEQARALVEDLQCDAAAPLLEPLASTAGPEQQAAMFMQGYCLAANGGTSAATERFRDAWSLDVNAKFPLDVEPKVQILVDATRNAVLKLQDAEAAAAFAKLAATVVLRVKAPPQVNGGQRITFDVELTDPNHAVGNVRLDWRMKGDTALYSLPTRRLKPTDGDTTVRLRAEIPGNYTVTPEDARTVEYEVVASDAAGRRLAGSASSGGGEVYVAKGSDIATDLRARERLPRGQRIFYAALAPVGGVMSTVAVGGGITALLAQVATPFGVGLLLGAIPIVGAATTSFFILYALSTPLLDGWAAFIPATLFMGIVTLGALGGAGVGLFGELGNITTVQPWVGRVALPTGVGVGVGTAFAFVVTAIAEVALVIADNPWEPTE